MSRRSGRKARFGGFLGAWCGYCRRIGPAYEKIGEEYADSLAVGKINIDEEPRLAGAEGIEDIPTLVLYRNGKAVDSITAPGSKAEIDRFIQEAWRNNGGFRYEQQSCL